MPNTNTANSIPTVTQTPYVQYVYLTPAPTTAQTQSPEDSGLITIPNFRGVSESEAKSILNGMGMHVLTREEYSKVGMRKGYVITQDIPSGTAIERNTIITLVVSKGPIKVNSQQATWYAWWVKGSSGDTYDFIEGSPYIYENDLYIKLKATMNSKYKHIWRGYGTASISDTFDKVVPITVEYEHEEMKKGEPQEITIIIPLQNLDVNRPTTISSKLEMYYGNNKTEEAVRIDFTFSWPDD